MVQEAALACPGCRRAVPTPSQFCPWCGTRLSGSTLRFAPPAVPDQAQVRSSRSLLRLWAVLVGLAAIFLLGAVGLWWAEVVLVPATFLAAYAWWDHIAERLEAPAGRYGRQLALNLWSSARLGRAGVRGWWRLGRTQVRVWPGELAWRWRHRSAIRLLGAAVFAGDEGGVAEAKALARQTGDQLERSKHERQQARAEARHLLRQERMATDATVQLDGAHLVDSARGPGQESPDS